MKQAFRLFRRNGVHYCHNNETGQHESPRTSNKGEARRLLSAENESACMGNLNLQIARAYTIRPQRSSPS
jgi:hypothetical protein